MKEQSRDCSNILFNFIITVAIGVVEGVVGSGGMIGFVYLWAVLIPSLAVGARRLHDTGRSGWWQPWNSLEDWKRHLHPDNVAGATQNTWDYIEGRTEEYESSFRLKHANGTYLWILSRGKKFS